MHAWPTAAGYAGARVFITGEIARARCRTQIDNGFGDAVTPGPIDATYPVLIKDLPAPRPANDPPRLAMWHAFLKKNELAL
jgi:hypothetical protein